VISRIRAAASEQDARLRRFRREHPEVMIITTLGLPKAWAGGEEITRATVRSLLDKLEEIVGGPEPATLPFCDTEILARLHGGEWA
jgi:hypothetical protein